MTPDRLDRAAAVLDTAASAFVLLGRCATDLATLIREEPPGPDDETLIRESLVHARRLADAGSETAAHEVRQCEQALRDMGLEP